MHPICIRAATAITGRAGASTRGQYHCHWRPCLFLRAPEHISHHSPIFHSPSHRLPIRVVCGAPGVRRGCQRRAHEVALLGQPIATVTSAIFGVPNGETLRKIKTRRSRLGRCDGSRVAILHRPRPPSDRPPTSQWRIRICRVPQRGQIQCSEDASTCESPHWPVDAARETGAQIVARSSHCVIDSCGSRGI